MSIAGKGHFYTIYIQVLYVLCFSRPRYQVSVYRTIGPLVYLPTYLPTYLPLYIYLSTGPDSSSGGASAFGAVGPGFESRPRHIKGIKNGTSSSLAGARIKRVVLER